MKNKFIYIANWKTYLSFEQEHDFITKNKDALKTLGNNYSLIICPSLEAMATIARDLKGTHISLGAQDCSAHQPGPYTGQVLAESLKQIGCNYGIVGHPEVRAEHHETNDTIAKKAIMLLTHSIIPIICIGETAKDYEIERGIQAIEEQLEPLFNTIAQKERNGYHLAIAYEPLWAIGSASMPKPEYVRQQVALIRQLAAEIIPQYSCTILYGGGIDEITIKTFKDVPELDGGIDRWRKY